MFRASQIALLVSFELQLIVFFLFFSLCLVVVVVVIEEFKVFLFAPPFYKLFSISLNNSCWFGDVIWYVEVTRTTHVDGR